MAHASSHTGPDSLARENKRLVKEILENCGREDRHGVENVLLIGKIGAGKSAFVNTLIKTITGRYYDRAKVGKGVTQSRTLRIVQYKSCGVTEEDLRLAGDACAFSDQELPKLPTVYDVPGLDTLTDDITEILRLLIAGRIPVGTGISGLQAQQKEHGIGSLGVIYKEVDPTAKINKIVFVQSAVDSVPTNLIEGLHSVLGETDSANARLAYEGDVFLVITHYDQVQDDPDPSELIQTVYTRGAGDADSTLQENHDSSDSPTNETQQFTPYEARTPSRISRSGFAKKEASLAKLFNIEGALERNRIYWRSFCDATGYDDDPVICNTALKFLTFIMKPTTPALPATPRVTIDWAMWAKLIAWQLKQHLKKLYDNFDFRSRSGFVVLAVIVSVVAIMLYFVYRALAASPDRM